VVPVGGGDLHKLLRMSKRQRTKHQGIKQREDRGGCTDANSEGDHKDQGKDGAT
jgi:hypothetical protein